MSDLTPPASAGGASRPGVGARLGNIASSLPLFTKLMVATLLCTYGLGAVYGAAVEYLALVPGNSIPYLWNVFTASWIETNAAALAVSCVLLIIVGEGGAIEGVSIFSKTSSPRIKYAAVSAVVCFFSSV